MKTLVVEVLLIVVGVGVACTSKYKSGNEEQHDPIGASGGSGAPNDITSSSGESGASGASTSSGACEDACSEGSRSCEDGSLRVCEPGLNSCWVWSAPVRCAGTNTCADDEGCLKCANDCSLGDSRCVDGMISSCRSDEFGCTSWSTPVACPEGTCDGPTACFGCDDECSSQDQSCANGAHSTCDLDERGCYRAVIASCESDLCADDTSCFLCNHQCDSGTTDCQAGQIRSCETDENGCLVWSTAEACSTGECMSTSACGICDDLCTLGSFDCTGSTLRECVTNSMGCRVWSDVRNCNGGEPICVASQGRCACDVAAPPHCQDRNTPEVCIDGTWTAEADCSGVSPRCVDGVGCQPCSENSDCPASGCHFLGPDQGACFDTADVLNVSNATDLEDTVKNLGSNAQAVIKLAAGTYDVDPFVIQNGQEVSLIGAAGTIITRSATGIDPNTMSLSFDSYLYLSNLTVADGVGARAVGSAQGSAVWIEDFLTYGYSYGVYGPGDKYIRRSRITGTTAGIGAVGGLLKLENSSIGPGADTAIIFNLGTATVDMRYVTLAGNALGMSCEQPYPKGTVRNSIIVSTGGSSFGGNFATACLDALTFIDNAVDQADYGAQVGAYQASWFVDPSQRDFHLTTAGGNAMNAIADWDLGDPTVDYDGDLRPTAERAAPGMDEP